MATHQPSEEFGGLDPTAEWDVWNTVLCQRAQHITTAKVWKSPRMDPPPLKLAWVDMGFVWKSGSLLPLDHEHDSHLNSHYKPISWHQVTDLGLGWWFTTDHGWPSIRSTPRMHLKTSRDNCRGPGNPSALRRPLRPSSKRNRVFL